MKFKLPHSKSKCQLVFLPLSFFFCGSALSSEFNTSLLAGNFISGDWNKTDRVSPGTYNLDVYVNNSWAGKFDIIIGSGDIIEMKKDDVENLPITGLDSISSDLHENVNLAELTHGGKVNFNSSLLRVEMTVPQAFLKKNDSQWIAPEKWDEGINGIYTGYNVSYNRSWQKQDAQENDSFYMTFRSGVNLRSWHLIDNAVYSKNGYQQKGQWISNERYLEKAFPGIKSVARIGRTFTNSDVFDNFRFTGLTVKQEQKMYPDSYVTYMPVVRGVAKGNATVRIYQNGSVVYQVGVPPGPFRISDLMPTGSRSDLNVVVEESDGSSQSFTVLYSTDTQMLRSGTAQWLFNSGRVDIQNVNYHPEFIQGNFSYGLNNYLTFLSGMTLSDNYKSFLFGGALAIPELGSVSLTKEGAFTDDDDVQGRGSRYKFTWSKYFSAGTSLSLSNSFSNRSDYVSFYDYVIGKSLTQRGMTRNSFTQERSNLSLNIDQVLPDGWGRFTLQGTRRKFWNTSKKVTDYSFSYNNNIGSVSYTISASKSFYNYDYSPDNSAYYGARRKSDNQIGLSVTIPFSMFSRRMSLSNSFTASNGSYSSSTSSISSSSDSVDYNLSMSNRHDGERTSGSVYAGWKNSVSRLTGNYSESASYRQAGGSASGTLVLWRDGVIASSGTGNTFVVLDAPGAADAIVNGNKSYKTNSAGRALIPSAAGYRLNTYQIAENDTDKDNTQIMDNIRYVAPWAGSISYIKYKTDRRKTFTFSATTQDQKSLPFGATVLDENQREAGYVAQGSQLYVKAEKQPAVLYVRLGDSTSSTGNKLQTCVIKKPVEGDSHENICRF